jgi:hypothetical protein
MRLGTGGGGRLGKTTGGEAMVVALLIDACEAGGAAPKLLGIVVYLGGLSGSFGSVIVSLLSRSFLPPVPPNRSERARYSASAWGGDCTSPDSSSWLTINTQNLIIQDYPRRYSAVVKLGICVSARDDNRALKRQARKETFGLAVGINRSHVRNGSRGFCASSDWPSCNRNVSAEGDVAAMHKGLDGIVRVQNKDAICDLSSNLRPNARPCSCNRTNVCLMPR